jgi:hypothetical protein
MNLLSTTIFFLARGKELAELFYSSISMEDLTSPEVDV